MSKYHFESDYRKDSLTWINKLVESKIKTDPYSKSETTYNHQDLEKLRSEIIQNQDAALAYFFTTEFNYKPHKMQKIILDNKDPKYAFAFARDVSNADIKALQNVVIAAKNIKYICHFACFVEGADLKRLEKIIITTLTHSPRDVQYAHKLLKHVSSSNVKKIKNIILASKKPRYLYELAKHLSSAKEIARIEDLIIASHSFTYMRLFAEHIEKCNLEKIEQAILDAGNTEQIKKFAKYVKHSKMRKFLLVL
jgi:hypothetical protein